MDAAALTLLCPGAPTLAQKCCTILPRPSSSHQPHHARLPHLDVLGCPHPDDVLRRAKGGRGGDTGWVLTHTDESLSWLTVCLRPRAPVGSTPECRILACQTPPWWWTGDARHWSSGPVALQQRPTRCMCQPCSPSKPLRVHCNTLSQPSSLPHCRSRLALGPTGHTAYILRQSHAPHQSHHANAAQQAHRTDRA